MNHGCFSAGIFAEDFRFFSRPLKPGGDQPFSLVAVWIIEELAAHPKKGGNYTKLTAGFFAKGVPAWKDNR
jgi:hypothetical protein